MKKISFPALIDGVASKKDRTLTIKLGTNELPPEDSAHLFDMANKQIYCFMSELELKEDDITIPDEIVEFKGEKSSSQRLSAVLFILWNTKTDKNKTFDEFRKSYMEKIIDNVKDKLD